MHQQGYVSLFIKVLAYQLMPQSAKKRVTERRLKKIVNYARENSPYLKALYKDVPADFELSQLPVVTKQEMMEHFDEYLTDRRLEHKGIAEFMSVQENNRKLYLGKYAVAMTSGSTGRQGVFVFDKTSQDISTIISHLRCIYFQFPLAALSLSKTFSLTNTMVYQAIKQLPICKYILALPDIQEPIETVVAELNKFRPRTLSGYPSSMAILADEANAGRLKIKPWRVVTGGEYLSDKAREYLKNTFHCEVRTNYACTEGGTIATECRHHHLHINTDWAILEPVDKDFNPVAPGELSDKVLLTCLYDFTQPKIRYEITDRVKIHYETCECGKKGPWIEVEGRLTDVLNFEENGEIIPVSPLAMPFEEIPGVINYQTILHPQNTVELRLSIEDGYTMESVWEEAQKEMKQLLNRMGIHNYTMRLSKLPPRVSPKTGKFRQIYQTNEVEFEEE